MRSTLALALDTALATALAAALLVLPACDKRYEFDTQAPAEAGLAELTLSRDKTGNGEITIGIEHLAPPTQIDGSLKAYVVWAQVGGKDPFKLGIMNYNEKKRSAKLDATYSENSFKVIITVEQDPSVAAPVGARILEAEVQAPKK